MYCRESFLWLRVGEIISKQAFSCVVLDRRQKTSVSYGVPSFVNVRVRAVVVSQLYSHVR